MSLVKYFSLGRFQLSLGLITTAHPWEVSYGALINEGYLNTHKRQQLTG